MVPHGTGSEPPGLIPFAGELEHMRLYLEIEKLRFGEGPGGAL